MAAGSETLAIEPEKLSEGELTDRRDDRTKMSQRERGG